MASSSELTLDCKPYNYSMLLKSFADSPPDQTMQKLEDFLSRLEDERLKINVFKRELPLCMQLLTNAVEASRVQLQAYRANEEPKPILEEFIPLRQPEISEETQNISDNKANWMISAQLWSQASNNEVKPEFSSMASSKEPSNGFNVSPSNIGLDNKQRNGGAFLPFSKDRSLRPALPELALAPVEDNNEVPARENCSNVGIEQEKGSGGSSSIEQMISNSSAANNSTGSQTQRKARRCWSPELHRRFVSALQMLGGSQAATPKQIRELMKVDGLTNDEVKSHLQKYRLHTRRPGPTPQAAGPPPPHLVFLGGIWVQPEYATTVHGGSAAIYGTHPPPHAPPHYCTASPIPQEFYAAPQPQQPQMHHPMQLHHQLQVYKATSQMQSLPKSDVRGAGDQSESIEDGKSESSSWKAESGENGGERKGLAKLREDLGEDSNGSEITLKF